MIEKIFYRAWLSPDEDGLIVCVDEWVSIRETPSLHFCVKIRAFNSIRCEDRFAYAKEHKMLKKIHKENSRFAFETVDDAIENLRFRKNRQIAHLKRDLIFAETFLGGELEKASHGNRFIVKNTRNIVHDHYNFDY